MTPYEWRIEAIEQKASRAFDSLYKLDTLRVDVDSLECSLRQACSCIDGLRSSLESTLDRVERLERALEENHEHHQQATVGVGSCALLATQDSRL